MVVFELIGANDDEQEAPQPKPRPPRGARASHRADQWRRYMETFINGGRRIGTFSRREMCAKCPQHVQRTDGNGNVSFGPLVTQKDWRDCTKALTDAGMLYKSSQGTILAPGALASDVWKREDLHFPRRSCPVTLYLDKKATNWST
jgi:hypothetical protein